MSNGSSGKGFSTRGIFNVHECSLCCRTNGIGWINPRKLTVVFPIFMVIDFHLRRTRACGCDYMCRLNELGSWCTSNQACFTPGFYLDDMKMDQLVYIKCWMLLWLTAAWRGSLFLSQAMHVCTIISFYSLIKMMQLIERLNLSHCF